MPKTTFAAARALAFLLFLLSGGCGGSGGGAAGLEVNPRSLSFSAEFRSPEPEPQSVLATVAAADAAYLLAGFAPGTPAAPWLTVSIVSDTRPAEVRLDVSTSTLPAGSYSATVRIGVARWA